MTLGVRYGEGEFGNKTIIEYPQATGPFPHALFRTKESLPKIPMAIFDGDLPIHTIEEKQG